MRTRFTRSRIASIAANGGVYTLDYNIPSGKSVLIIELFTSTDTSLQKVEILYSNDNGTTWSNPFDAGSDHILQLWISAGVPVLGKPDATWFDGGANVLLRVKVTNLHPTNTSNVYLLVKGWEHGT